MAYIRRGDRTCFVAKLRAAVLEIPRGQEVEGDRTKKKPGSGGCPLIRCPFRSIHCSKRLIIARYVVVDSVNCFQGTKEAFVEALGGRRSPPGVHTVFRVTLPNVLIVSRNQAGRGPLIHGGRGRGSSYPRILVP